MTNIGKDRSIRLRMNSVHSFITVSIFTFYSSGECQTKTYGCKLFMCKSLWCASPFALLLRLLFLGITMQVPSNRSVTCFRMLLQHGRGRLHYVHAGARLGLR